MVDGPVYPEVTGSPIGETSSDMGSGVRPSRTGTNTPGRPRAMPDPYEPMPGSRKQAREALRDFAAAGTDTVGEGLSLKATYADAILAAKAHIEAAEALLVGSAMTIDNHVAISEAWSALAYACGNPPGRR
jgi:hypothetical protein